MPEGDEKSSEIRPAHSAASVRVHGMGEPRLPFQMLVGEVGRRRGERERRRRSRAHNEDMAAPRPRTHTHTRTHQHGHMCTVRLSLTTTSKLSTTDKCHTHRQPPPTSDPAHCCTHEHGPVHSTSARSVIKAPPDPTTACHHSLIGRSHRPFNLSLHSTPPLSLSTPRPSLAVP